MRGPEEKFRRRADAGFAAAIERIDAETDLMLTNHSARGLLRSGATIIAALEILERRFREALDDVLTEAAKLIEHRGGAWRKAMRGIEQSLAAHLAEAPLYIARARKVADRPESPSVGAAIEERLDGIRCRLEKRVADYREGCTARVSKKWTDRHPFIFQVMLLVFGALVVLGGAFAAGLLHLR